MVNKGKLVLQLSVQSLQRTLQLFRSVRVFSVSWAALLLGTLGADVAVLGVATSTPQFTKSHSSGGVVMATLAAEAAMDSMAL